MGGLGGPAEERLDPGYKASLTSRTPQCIIKGHPKPQTLNCVAEEHEDELATLEAYISSSTVPQGSLVPV